MQTIYQLAYQNHSYHRYLYALPSTIHILYDSLTCQPELHLSMSFFWWHKWHWFASVEPWQSDILEKDE